MLNCPLSYWSLGVGWSPASLCFAWLSQLTTSQVPQLTWRMRNFTRLSPTTRWRHWHSLPRAHQLWPSNGKLWTASSHIHLVLLSLTLSLSFCSCPFCHLVHFVLFVLFPPFCPFPSKSLTGLGTSSAASLTLWRSSREALSKTSSTMRKSQSSSSNIYINWCHIVA